MPRLENWKIISRIDIDGKPYKKLVGTVYGHPNANSDNNSLVDGNSIVTSRIIDIDFTNNIAITESGTVYELGSE